MLFIFLKTIKSKIMIYWFPMIEKHAFFSLWSLYHLWKCNKFCKMRTSCRQMQLHSSDTAGFDVNVCSLILRFDWCRAQHLHVILFAIKSLTSCIDMFARISSCILNGQRSLFSHRFFLSNAILSIFKNKIYEKKKVPFAQK